MTKITGQDEENTLNGKPLITFALFAYNLEGFIEEAIAGAFSQTYSPLEIVLSDDSSRDGTFQVMQRMAASYRGEHRVILNRNETNLGTGAHVNRIMQLAKGQLIIAAGGDDISLPTRVERIYQTHKLSNGAAKSIFSNAQVIDETGKPTGRYFHTAFSPAEFLPKVLASKDFVLLGASHAWTRDVFDQLGPLLTPLTCEDTVIGFRSALLGSVCYVDEPLIMYRDHQHNVWKLQTRDAVAWERFMVYEKQSVYKNWLQDLQRVKAPAPERNREIGEIEKIVLDRLMLVEEDIEFITGNYAKKIVAILRAIRRGETLRRIRHKIGVFFMPSLYRYYIRIKR